jgi:hypothetical protein
MECSLLLQGKYIIISAMEQEKNTGGQHE